MMDRPTAARLGHETLDILRAGRYTAPSGAVVSIRDAVEAARIGSTLHRPGSLSEQTIVAGPTETAFSVTPESTFAAARRLEAERPGCDPCCLNFASARHPGGGFLHGSRAQEESLARASGLYACIEPMHEMYDFNHAQPTTLYSDYMIHSPRVPIFRDDDGTLLEAISFASILTAAAVNVRHVRDDERPLVEPTMRRRMEMLLRVAHHHGHRTLVLGAWGCGAFHNDANSIAGMFADFLREGSFRNVFERVVFAVLDFSDARETFEAFRKRFG